MKTYKIEVKSLSCRLGGKVVISGIDLKMETGKFYSIIGPNGSGKTTLLRTMTGSLEPDRGQVFIDRVSVADTKSKSLARSIAYVSQNTSIDLDFSVLDYVLMGRYPYLGLLQSEGDKDLDYARKAMEITNTWHLREANINEISGGERQRAVIARAVAQDTPIIFLDEPISQLDIHHQLDIMDTLQNMKKQRDVTVVTVLHDLNMASQYSDYIILMNNGRVFKQGVPQDVLNREVISEVYGKKVRAVINPETGRPLIIPSWGNTNV